MDGYQCDVLFSADGLSSTDDQVKSSLTYRRIYWLFKIMTKVKDPVYHLHLWERKI